MNYGYFDDKNREYVITNPKTPAPWANYLGDPEYGALISNNAGGYSFLKSGANGRILRYVFNAEDKPGRYIYIRDNDNKDFYTISWAPICKDLKAFKNECHHGMGYTRIISEYDGICSKALYYVPKGKKYEVWNVKIKNNSSKERSLTVTGYAEFTNNPNYEQDQINLQYSLFITRTTYLNNCIQQAIHGNVDGIPEDVHPEIERSTKRFFALVGSDVSSYTGDRNEFLGAYGSYNRPEGVMNGDLGNTDSYNENSCGALSTKITLKPGEEKNFSFILGGTSREGAFKIMPAYLDTNTCENEVLELKNQWNERFNHFQVKTPSKEFDTMINTWNAYNCFMTFIWSRAASFIYCGLRNGYGYRDTVQDISGIIHLKPEMAKEKIEFMLSAQVHHGGGLPLVKFDHNAGHEDTPEDESYRKSTGHPEYRADDALWLFPTVYKYIAETGDIGFLDKVIPFADKDEGSVYNHLARAIDFSLKHLGGHGLPAGLYADWNDCLRLGKLGESSFVAFQLYYALGIMEQFATVKKDNEYKEFLSSYKVKLDNLIHQYYWDDNQFVRGFTEEGEIIGKSSDPEANLWLNPQSWSVISGLATKKEADIVLDKVYTRLNTKYGAVLIDPPYCHHPFMGFLAEIYNKGVKENGGIFSQTQGWIILAEALAGHGNHAFEYFMENAPSSKNDEMEIRQMEPYCYGQFTEGPTSMHFGRSHVHWLTGTASTMMWGCVEGILGMRPNLEGLQINPSIPSNWDKLEINKDFRGHKLHIEIVNPNKKESGVSELYIDGIKQNSNFVSETQLKDKSEIKVVM